MAAGWRRGLLWLAFGTLLAGLLATAVTLALRFEEHQAQQQLALKAANLADQLRSGLARNVRTLQALAFQVRSPEAWRAPALEVLENNPEMLLLERHDRNLNLVVARTSPYYSPTPAIPPREAGHADLEAACTQARLTHLPTYTSSYDWPLANGTVTQAVDKCLPKIINGELVGFLVVAYNLPGMLTELTNISATKDMVATLTDLGGRPAPRPDPSHPAHALVAEHMLELTGHILVLKLESPDSAWEPTLWNVPGLVVGMSSLILLAAVALARDMTLRLQAEQQLAEALAVRKAMENALVTGLMARDLLGRLTYVNPAFCRLLQRPATQLLGQNLPDDCWPTEAAHTYRQQKARQWAGPGTSPEGIESTFVRRDGTPVPVLVFETPLLNTQGAQTGWMGAVVDLTEQHRAEATSRASLEQLQATARLASVGEMATLLSHELNQPLSAIASYATGSLNLLAQADHPPEQVASDMAQAMARIQAQAERAGRVIHSVGNFVRRRERSGALVREPVSVPQLVQTILPLVNLQARRDGVRVALDIDPRCPPLLCDRTMVEQVLLNLARNAIQAMAGPGPGPGPDSVPDTSRATATNTEAEAATVTATPAALRVLTLSARPLGHKAATATPAWVEISVTDHGHGISEVVERQLFTPFFSTRAQGMGLGLSLCRTVVEQHGGTLTHAPAQPCGTVFHLTLPTAPNPQGLNKRPA